ncbi:hypothetical protein BT96DRAFT_943253 [Gymnopus androsaceus JB14]|uniref:Uncharacterized protein n=1 Tax=Gymnopus androsaceus JB14 TaxID=1447944 RepID=A0A6A4H9P3_9AGAR|nr:hypothetical protein BT96DRAFT_943253 [Gymnopus androsaceus JB14]
MVHGLELDEITWEKWSMASGKRFIDDILPVRTGGECWRLLFEDQYMDILHGPQIVFTLRVVAQKVALARRSLVWTITGPGWVHLREAAPNEEVLSAWVKTYRVPCPLLCHLRQPPPRRTPHLLRRRPAAVLSRWFQPQLLVASQSSSLGAALSKAPNSLLASGRCLQLSESLRIPRQACVWSGQERVKERRERREFDFIYINLSGQLQILPYLMDLAYPIMRDCNRGGLDKEEEATALADLESEGDG